MWEAYGQFGHNDVHYQVVIVLKTPSYNDGIINAEKKVKIQLERPSDDECSEGMDFTFFPTVNQGIVHESIVVELSNIVEYL